MDDDVNGGGSASSLRWILDSAVSLAILTGAMVILGYAMRRAYYERLSYPSFYPLDPPHAYVVVAAGFGSAVILTVIAGFLTTFLASRLRMLPDRYRAVVANAGFLVLPVVLLALVVSRGDATWTTWMAGIVYAALPVILGMAGQPVVGWGSSPSLSSPMLSALVLMAFLVCYTVAVATGEGSAKRLVEGRYERGSVIELTMNDATSPLSGLTFGLIDIREGNVFVVELADPAPERPALHIIPQSEIRMSRVQRMDGGLPAPASTTDAGVSTPTVVQEMN